MTDNIYRVELSKTAAIWAGQNGYNIALANLSEAALSLLQNGDFLEVENQGGEAALFSIERKIVKVSRDGALTVRLFLDYPAH
ncbi:hypothetical protein [Pseudochrobactrum sp. HB0163]|uniref:hypothetical protein n=1 Tax=Pseudochrobactrum sp. HB0163 TaxID=3450708 RepID=UPI003F6E34B0